MKAFCILEPGRTGIVDIPKPAAGAGEVLLRVHTVGYCGSDLSTFRGMNPMVKYPRIPGHEISGVIEACGAGVPAEWAAGTEVTVSPYTSCGRCSACRQQRFNCCRDNQTLGVQRDGAMTEYIAVPWQKLFRAARLSLRDLALVEPLTVGFHAADRGRVSAADTVLVFGCGAIGLGAIAGAAFRGARVIAVDIDDTKLQLARKCGAAETINSAAVPLHERVQELTGGSGPEVIIEAAGLPQTFRGAVEEVCFAGRIVYIGYAKKPVEYETKYFVQKELDIMGSRNATPADFQNVIRLLEGGAFPVSEIVTMTVPFAEAGAALEKWAANPALVTKILVTIG
jgi:threonine dehydrogenase-like Zn-dependent dehydrogenase